HVGEAGILVRLGTRGHIVEVGQEVFVRLLFIFHFSIDVSRVIWIAEDGVVNEESNSLTLKSSDASE
ncbi:16898_t:CDS:2, partial [Rhizophagus irregularis]